MRSFLCATLVVLLALAAAAADVSARWSGTLTPEGGDANPAYVILKQSGGSLTGSGGPDEGQQWPLENGKVAGDKVSFEVKSPDNTVYKCELLLAGDSLKGDVVATRPDGEVRKARLELARVK